MEFTKHLRNIIGWTSDHRIVVIESDDWGSTRFHDRGTRDYFLRKHPALVSSWMNVVDCLEDDDDMEELYNVLSKHKDKRGRPPVITALFNVANPDYEKIRQSAFESYFFEPITQTAESYGNRKKLLELYQTGIRSGVFVPEYHGREHLHVNRWVEALKFEGGLVRDGFENKFWSFAPSNLEHKVKDLRASFDVDSETDLDTQRQNIHEGLALFERVFGYKASYFVPPNGPFNKRLEKDLVHCQISGMGVSKKEIEPLPSGKTRRHLNYLGKVSSVGLVYITRNCVFEPGKPFERDWVDSCMLDISVSFRWRKPAVISTHRANYTGYLNESNRYNGLRNLNLLLTRILDTWPDVSFLTSKELIALIRQGRKSNQGFRFV